MDKNVQIVMTQTNYTEQQAIEYLRQMNNDPIQVVRHYLGICTTNENKTKKVSSIHQEIFKQYRKCLDIQEYRDKNPIRVEEAIENLQQIHEKYQKTH